MCTRNNLVGLFAAETGFILEKNPDTVRAPDIAFVRASRLPHPLPRKYLTIPPDLAVETLSPDDRPRRVKEKINQLLKSGVRLIWVVDPQTRTVTVHRPPMEPRVLHDGDFLEGEEVVPGFRFPVTEIWS